MRQDMNQEEKNELWQAILELVPADGSTIGNISLMDEMRAYGINVSSDDYHSVKNEMVEKGLLGKGRGRGGAVYRKGKPDQESTAAQKPSTAPDPLASSGSEKLQTDQTASSPVGPYGTYQHDAPAASRPDVGVQEQFNVRRRPRTFRYDSSLAPELSWDENAEREFADWLLELISDAAQKGEEAVFAEDKVWKGTKERFLSIGQCVARLRSLTQPFLNWAGKAERQEISVPTVPLFVHERHSTENILKTLDSHRASGTMLDLFDDQRGKDVADQLDAYTHTEDWSNRLILGDSLQVMNSLLEYEGLGGQVQMIYLDPPYGVKFGSNFQPFVRRRDMGDKHGKDNWMIREPEMVKAYRDTWELGLHSYLNYLRDRLLIAKDLLAESGSLFVQMSGRNIHHVREILDEIFGQENFVTIISFVSTSGFADSKSLSRSGDYLIWYSKKQEKMRFNPLFKDKVLGQEGTGTYTNIELSDGSRMSIAQWEKKFRTKFDYANRPAGSRVFAIGDLASSGAPSQAQPFAFESEIFHPGSSNHWKANYPEGMENLAEANRIFKRSRGGIGYVRYFDDFQAQQIANIWTDTSSSFMDKYYVVQTSTLIVQRCILMTTDPGDLILDPTCGSGTTADVAEKWGRRWITCDTSRVPLALARQRLLTATYPWYELVEPAHGPSGGFEYKRKENRKGEEIGGLVPRITLQSIANNEEPQTVKLVDRPESNKKVTRVCGPFTVEATIQAAQSIGSEKAALAAEQEAGYDARTYFDRMIEVVRRARNLNLPGNRRLQLDTVRPVDSEHLHAEATDENDHRIAIFLARRMGPSTPSKSMMLPVKRISSSIISCSFLVLPSRPRPVSW